MDGDNRSPPVTSDQQTRIAQSLAAALLNVMKQLRTPITAGSKLHEYLMAINKIPLESAGKDYVDAVQSIAEGLLGLTKQLPTPNMAGSELHDSQLAIRNIPLESAGKDYVDSVQSVAEGLLGLTKQLPTPVMAESNLHDSLSEIRNIPLESAGKNFSDSVAHALEDPMPSEITFRFTVAGVHNHQSLKTLSPPFYFRGLLWRILVKTSSYNERYLDFSLQCYEVSESVSEDWWCDVKGELRLISHALNRKPFCTKIDHTYGSHSTEYEYYFISWADVMNPAAGYVKDDVVTMELYMKAESAQGIP